MTEEQGHVLGCTVAMRLSSMVMMMPSDEAGDGFMRAIKEWHDFIETGAEPLWMKEIMESTSIN